MLANSAGNGQKGPDSMGSVSQLAMNRVEDPGKPADEKGSGA